MTVLEDMKKALKSLEKQPFIDSTMVCVSPYQQNWIRKNWHRFHSSFKTRKFIPMKEIKETNSLIPATIYFDELAEVTNKQKKYMLGLWKDTSDKKPLPTARKNKNHK